MLHCKKRKYPIHAISTDRKTTKQWSEWHNVPVSLADAVCDNGQGVPNYKGARIPVTSHFNLTAWESYLTAYDNKILVDFLIFGLPINCDKSVLPKSTLQNHCSATGANGQHILNTYICKELSYHSVCGPHRCNPAIAAKPASSHNAFACMITLFSELGFQASPEKDNPSSCEMTCLGVQINTASFVLTVPQFRLHE